MLAPLAIAKAPKKNQSFSSCGLEVTPTADYRVRNAGWFPLQARSPRFRTPPHSNRLMHSFFPAFNLTRRRWS
jgi:hypothetical protein